MTNNRPWYLPLALMAEFSMLRRRIIRNSRDVEEFGEVDERLDNLIREAYQAGYSDGYGTGSCKAGSDHEVQDIITAAQAPPAKPALSEGDPVTVVGWGADPMREAHLRLGADGALFATMDVEVGAATGITVVDEKPGTVRKTDEPTMMSWGSQSYPAGARLHVTTSDGQEFEGALSWDKGARQWRVAGRRVQAAGNEIVLVTGHRDDPEIVAHDLPRALKHGTMTYLSGTKLRMTLADGQTVQGPLTYDIGEGRGWTVDGWTVTPTRALQFLDTTSDDSDDSGEESD